VSGAGRCCLKCGTELALSGRAGRPRQYCLDCRPPGGIRRAREALWRAAWERDRVLHPPVVDADPAARHRRIKLEDAERHRLIRRRLGLDPDA
jgi:hypothetical protein